MVSEDSRGNSSSDASSSSLFGGRSRGEVGFNFSLGIGASGSKKEVLTKVSA